MGAVATMVAFGLVYSYGVFFKPLAAELGYERSVIAGAFSMYTIVHDLFVFLRGDCWTDSNQGLIWGLVPLFFLL